MKGEPLFSLVDSDPSSSIMPKVRAASLSLRVGELNFRVVAAHRRAVIADGRVQLAHRTFAPGRSLGGFAGCALLAAGFVAVRLLFVQFARCAGAQVLLHQYQSLVVETFVVAQAHGRHPKREAADQRGRRREAEPERRE